jgi:hypothetical protein
MRPFIDFVKERTYLKNVSPRTIEFYWDCHKAVLRFGDFTEEGPRLSSWKIRGGCMQPIPAPAQGHLPPLVDRL